MVSNVDKNSFLSKSIFWAILPMVERPNDPTCNWCNLKKRLLLNSSFNAFSIAKKNGELLNNSTV